ncbi:MAG: hypothetical protein CMI54_02510 [Parcubacteria group bacterium]|jgi:hypothetical protein|nr:hypothetical protein [Parcubacteria group bacterium]|tara:strand:+ start:7128 stop:7538 length:411 start_codon:yes stop_codon:yes gene_type:complete
MTDIKQLEEDIEFLEGRLNGLQKEFHLHRERYGLLESKLLEFSSELPRLKKKYISFEDIQEPGLYWRIEQSYDKGSGDTVQIHKGIWNIQNSRATNIESGKCIDLDGLNLDLWQRVNVQPLLQKEMQRYYRPDYVG